MEITPNIFLLAACMVLVLYIVFIFILFLPTLGFGIIPIVILAAFGGFAIVASVVYNNYSPDNDYVSQDTVYIAGMVVAAILFFIITLFIFWFLYTQWSKPREVGRETLLDLSEHIEDEKEVMESPFKMENK